MVKRRLNNVISTYMTLYNVVSTSFDHDVPTGNEIRMKLTNVSYTNNASYLVLYNMNFQDSLRFVYVFCKHGVRCFSAIDMFQSKVVAYNPNTLIGRIAKSNYCSLHHSHKLASRQWTVKHMKNKISAKIT